MQLFELRAKKFFALNIDLDKDGSNLIFFFKKKNLNFSLMVLVETTPSTSGRRAAIYGRAQALCSDAARSSCALNQKNKEVVGMVRCGRRGPSLVVAG